MIKKNSFVKQAAILAIASLLVRFIGFLYRLPLTKLIGDEGNGIYSAGYYLYTFFLIMSSAGLPAAISKMVSERIAKNEYKNAHMVFRISIIIASVVGLIASLLIGIGARWFSNAISSPRSFYTIVTLSPTVFIVAVAAVFRGYFQGLKNTVPTAISQVVEQIFNAVFSVLLAYVLVKKSVELGAAGGTAGTGIGAFFGLVVMIWIYYLHRPNIKKDFHSDKTKIIENPKAISIELIKTAVPIIIGTAIFSITNLIDMKMVMTCLTANGAFTEHQADILYGQLTGKYVVLTTLPVSIATAVATAVVPNIASSFILKDMNAVENKINTALRITMILSIPAAVGIGVLGHQILLMLFPSYPDGGNLLVVGSISIIFLALAQIATGILQGIDKVKIPAIAAFFGALVKIPLNYVLISNPKINVLGAVISTIGCYSVASVIDLYFMARQMKAMPDFMGALIKPLIASFVMGIGCYVSYNLIYMLVSSNTLSLILAILIGIVIYFIFLILLKGLKRVDIKLMPMGNKLITLMDKHNILVD